VYLQDGADAVVDPDADVHDVVGSDASGNDDKYQPANEASATHRTQLLVAHRLNLLVVVSDLVGWCRRNFGHRVEVVAGAVVVVFSVVVVVSVAVIVVSAVVVFVDQSYIAAYMTNATQLSLL